MSELDIYADQGFGNTSGFGTHPALLIVDFVNGFADPGQFGGGNILDAIGNTKPLLALARAKGLPVAYSRAVYADDGSDAGVFGLKVPSLKALTEHVEASAIVAALAPVEGEHIVRKTQPSMFFGTGLADWLKAKGVDTVMVTGCTTSGCVRATVVDAMSHNFLTIVVTDCVGDRALAPHDANLFDMAQKYADVMARAEVMARLESLG